MMYRSLGLLCDATSPEVKVFDMMEEDCGESVVAELLMAERRKRIYISQYIYISLNITREEE